MKAGAIARCMQACRGSVAQQAKQALSLSNAEFSRTSLMLLKTCSKPDSSHVASIAKPKKSFKKSECSNFTKMSKLLLVTDSNFLNNIGDYKGPKIKNLEVKQCKSRKSAIEELMTIDEGIIVFSCLDTIAADVAKTTLNDADSAVELYINQFLFKIVERVDETDGKVLFGITAPLFWNSHPEPIRRAMNHAFKLLKRTPMDKVWFSEYFKDVFAGGDGVHLTNRSAEHYISQVFGFFKNISELSTLNCVEFEPVNDQTDQPAQVRTDWADEPMEERGQPLLPPDDVPSPARTTSMLSASILAPISARVSSGSGYASTQSRLIRLANPYVSPFPDLSMPPPTAQSQGQVTASIAQLERRVGSLESRTFYNDLMTAGLKEELDTEANKAMLNRVIVSGVELPELQSAQEGDRVKIMKDKIVELFDLIKTPEQSYEVVFVRHLNRQKRGAQLAVIEVKLADSKQAQEIRSEFVKKRKELPAKLNVSPVVRLATRVRIEIMHAIADLFKKYDRSVTSAYCLQYIPKPVIKIIRKSVGVETTRTVSFCDAISWVQEQNLVDVIDLRKARERAGRSLTSTLSQHFVILN